MLLVHKQVATYVSGATKTFTIPNTVEPGDLILLLFANGNSATELATIGGFSNFNPSITNGRTVLHRTADFNDKGKSYTVTSSGSSIGWVLLVYRGAQIVDAVRISNSTNTLSVAARPNPTKAIQWYWSSGASNFGDFSNLDVSDTAQFVKEKDFGANNTLISTMAIGMGAWHTAENNLIILMDSVYTPNSKGIMGKVLMTANTDWLNIGPAIDPKRQRIYGGSIGHTTSNSLGVMDFQGNVLQAPQFPTIGSGYGSLLYLGSIDKVIMFQNGSSVTVCDLDSNGLYALVNNIYTFANNLSLPLTDLHFACTFDKVYAYQRSTGRVYLVDQDWANYTGQSLQLVLLCTIPAQLMSGTQNLYYSFGTDGEVVILKDGGTTAVMYDISTGAVIKSLTFDSQVDGIAISNDGLYTVTFDSNGWATGFDNQPHTSRWNSDSPGTDPIGLYRSNFKNTAPSNRPKTYFYNKLGTPNALPVPQLKKNDSITFLRTGWGREGTILQWKVPQTGKYRIKTIGASGGKYNAGSTFPNVHLGANTNVGKGAILEGDFILTEGTILKILVGQRPLPAYSTASPGGGGTFVTKLDNTPLLIAGGGGGKGGSYQGRDAVLSSEGSKDFSNTNAGGTDGYGGVGNGYGGGGAGLLGNAVGTASAIPAGNEAKAFVNGGMGAYYPNDPNNGSYSQVSGGFGGGGSAHYAGGGGGGGGGYSGGGGGHNISAYYGGGGGSSLNGGGTNVTSVVSPYFNEGLVTFTLLESVVVPEPVKLTSPTITTKNHGESVELSWDNVKLPIQTIPGVVLDEEKVFYEITYFPDGITPIVSATDRTLTKYTAKIIASGSNNSKFAIRPFLKSNGKRYYGEYTYTNSFITNEPPADALMPTALLLNGVDSVVSISSPMIPALGDFTIELSFRTSSKKSNCIFSTGTTGGLEVFVNSVGAVALYPKGITTIDHIDSIRKGLNDGRIHRLAIVFSTDKFLIYIDDVLDTTYPYVKPTYPGQGIMVIGDIQNATAYPDSNYKFDGVISLPRVWNDVRTQQELVDNKNKVVATTEQGLVEYLTFDPKTGKVKGKKNPLWTGWVDGIVGLAYLFVALEVIKLPIEGDFQRAENLNYIRNQVNLFRTENGLNPIEWVDPIVVKGFTTIKAVHWNEIEDGILEVFATSGQEFNSKAAEAQLKEDIKPRDTAYPIVALGGRINNILKALKNQ